MHFHSVKCYPVEICQVSVVFVASYNILHGPGNVSFIKFQSPLLCISSLYVQMSVYDYSYVYSIHKWKEHISGQLPKSQWIQKKMNQFTDRRHAGRQSVVRTRVLRYENWSMASSVLHIVHTTSLLSPACLLLLSLWLVCMHACMLGVSAKKDWELVLPSQPIPRTVGTRDGCYSSELLCLHVEQLHGRSFPGGRTLIRKNLNHFLCWEEY